MGIPFQAGGSYQIKWNNDSDEVIEVEAWEMIGGDFWAVLADGKAYNLHFVKVITPLIPHKEITKLEDLVIGSIDWDYDFKNQYQQTFETEDIGVAEAKIRCLGTCENYGNRVEVTISNENEPTREENKEIKGRAESTGMVRLKGENYAIPCVLVRAQPEADAVWFEWHWITQAELKYPAAVPADSETE